MKNFSILKGQNKKVTPEQEILFLQKRELSKKTKKYLQAYQWYVERCNETKQKTVLSFSEYRKNVPIEVILNIVSITKYRKAAEPS